MVCCYCGRGQPLTKASATDSAVMLVKGITSGQRVNLSMQVRMYVKPLDGGSGPTRSMWIMSNRGVIVCLCTLARWQGMHDPAHFRTSALMLGHTYRVVSRRSVARTPGCDSECKESNTFRLNACGTNGRGTPVERSQRSDAGMGMVWRSREDEEGKGAVRSGSFGCAFTISSKSIPWSNWSVFNSIRDSSSATGLAAPCTWRMSLVNCDTKSRCLTCRGECCSEREVSARVSGLWSVNTANCRPSTMWRKCRIAR